MEKHFQFPLQILCLCLLILAATACGSSKKNTQEQEDLSEEPTVQAPLFNADSAYATLHARLNSDRAFPTHRPTATAATTSKPN